MASPRENPSPFETLGLPLRLDLTRAEIERAYLSRIAALHPDLAGTGADPDEQDRVAAALNDAKAELLDAERRAEAVLAAHGGPSKSEDKSFRSGFLAEIMETREQLEEELADPAATPAVRDKWRAWALDRRTEHLAQLAPLLAAPTPASLKQARAILNEWRYAERLLERLDGRTHE